MRRGDAEKRESGLGSGSLSRITLVEIRTISSSDFMLAVAGVGVPGGDEIGQLEIRRGADMVCYG